VLTSINLMPGVHHVSIWNQGQEKDKNPIIKINKHKNTKINVTFVLTGLNSLRDHITQERRPFYIYLFLVFNNGGKDFEILSNSDIYCNEKILAYDNVKFNATLEIPPISGFKDVDFLNNYFTFDIVYSEFEAQDGSDINLMINNHSNKLFSSKINLTFIDEYVEGDSND
jgi:hypothetical protein